MTLRLRLLDAVTILLCALVGGMLFAQFGLSMASVAVLVLFVVVVNTAKIFLRILVMRGYGH